MFGTGRIVADSEFELSDVEDEIESEEGPDQGSTSEDDISSLFFDITTFTLDWTVSTIVGRMRDGAIDISPSYQRRPVWSADKSWRLVESLMLGIPVPQLVLAARKNARGQFVVLDGKQRLLALENALSASKNPDYRVPKFELLGQLSDRPFSEILNESSLAQHWDAFLNSPIRTVVVQGYRQNAALHEIFHRLNQNNVPLSPQELRKSLTAGPFMDWLDVVSAESKQIRAARRLGAADFRMRDAETVLRYLAFARHLPEYKGNLRLFLDQEARFANKRWDEVHEDYERLMRELDEAIKCSFSICGETTFFRMNTGGKYFGRFNAALFDVLVLTLRHPHVRELVKGHEPALKARLDRLCLESPFRDYITLTTKSVESVRGRIRLWIDELQDELKVSLDIPETALP
jgi:hypothetical protein